MQKSAMSSTSFCPSTAPVGLHGKFSISTRVFGVTAFSSMSRVRRNSSSRRVSTHTGTPPARMMLGR